MSDPTAPIVMTAADVEPTEISKLAALNTALATKQAADRAAGKCVTKPAGYRIATPDERADFTKRAKAIDRASRIPDKDGKLGPAWANQLDAGNVVFSQGYWWVKV